LDAEIRLIHIKGMAAAMLEYVFLFIEGYMRAMHAFCVEVATKGEAVWIARAGALGRRRGPLRDREPRDVLGIGAGCGILIT